MSRKIIKGKPPIKSDLLRKDSSLKNAFALFTDLNIKLTNLFFNFTQ